MPDISPYAQFDWYEPVYYWDTNPQFPFERKILGHWISIAKVATDLMAFYILTPSGRILVCKGVWALTTNELCTPEVQVKLAKLTKSIAQQIGDNVAKADVADDILNMLPEVPMDLFKNNDEAVIPYDPDRVK